MQEELTKYLDKKFQKIDNEFLAVKEDLREARGERQVLEKRINDTYKP